MKDTSITKLEQLLYYNKNHHYSCPLGPLLYKMRTLGV